MAEQKPQQQSNTLNFNELELEILKFWEENNIFEKSLEQTKNGQPYIFYDGPPFATGLPHYGSILPSVIKDCLPRYQTMKGRFVRRRWGWDCHGLPIENIVEKNLKISGKKQIEEIGVERFNQVCRENVLRFAEEWGKVIKRIGRWVDFDNSYKTMDTGYQESVWWALQQLWQKQLIFEDRKVLLYCSRCETPISNFEVAMDNSYRDITEESVYSKFKLLPRQRIANDLTDDKTYALAWTTTPWTLPANASLNVGTDIVYVLIEQNAQRHILAKDRLQIIQGEYELISEFPARALEGLKYEPPFPGVIPDNGKSFMIYRENFVTVADGTGIVHSAVMYGEEDFLAAKKAGLPQVVTLDHKGQYFEENRIPEYLRGVFFKDAEKPILKDLEKRGLVYKIENYSHSYPHCYRCGTPLFYSALPAWFINIQSVKDKLIENNRSVNWYPEHLKYGRFQLGIQNAPDWNISRNRYWATALPFWKCGNAECKNTICVGSINELFEKSINFKDVYPQFVARPFMGNQDAESADKSAHYSSAELESLDLHKPFIDRIILKCDKCGGDMRRVPEVVDCWVESGSMPFAELHHPFENNELFAQRFPADFVVEYIPQTRAWFYVMHVISTILFGQAPFRNVLTTGTILGEDGSKMSKSKGNYPDPNLVINKYGADALRFYLLTSPVVNGDDINFSEKSVAEVNRKLSLIFYNVWSFYRMYEKELVSISADKLLSSQHILDKWILSRLSQVIAQVTADMDSYNTVRAGRGIVDFINDLSTWYLRRSRERIKEVGENSKKALQTLGFVLVELAKLLAPFMPYLSDFIYKDLTGEQSVHLALWPSLDALPFEEKVIEEMEIVREIASLGLSVRKEKMLPVRQPLRAFGFELQNKNLDLGPELVRLIEEELNVKAFDLSLLDKDLRPEGVAAGAGIKTVKQFYLDLNLSDELKQEGLAREMERLVQDLRKKSGLKLGELVDVYYNAADEKLESALLSMFDRKKTFVSQISKSLEVEVDFEQQAVVAGKTLWIGLIKI